MSYKKNYNVTWDQFHTDAKLLAERLLPLGPFQGIIAITRGGLLPAAIIARELDIHLIETLCITSYDWQKQDATGCTVLKAPEAKGAGWIIIDDLVDTGKTALMAKQMFPEAPLATLYAKPAGRPHVDVCISEVSQDTWVLFPWDASMQYVAPLVGAGKH